jgi:hypothetical protein
LKICDNTLAIVKEGDAERIYRRGAGEGLAAEGGYQSGVQGM